MTAPYRLHYAPDNASVIVRLTLEELGVPYETLLLERSKQAQAAPAYLALNPGGLIPTLETPEGTIFETGAILLWLADRHGRLAPAPDAPARGDFLKWLFYLANTAHTALRMSFYPEKYVGPDQGAQDLLRATMQAHFAGHLDILETRATPWFSTDCPSVLDYYLACLMRWRALYPEGLCSGYDANAWPRLTRLLEHLETRPATQRAALAEGLGAQPFTAPDYCNPPEGSAT
ncbi:glutathione S-transferase family protein [Roseovarius sp. 217]|uniref:glutathione S-transferase family protein n=1 Tax=Roseovarius sp. (strain 217) TaxID=314264 RepID=UPI0000687DB4|nr:glutathione S-transferase family protein [Roseovarius sp. 217]EAQ24269.1 glutathione S-transferase family protein [Roseovarius sp. 217]